MQKIKETLENHQLGKLLNKILIVSGSIDKTVRLWYAFEPPQTNIKQDFQLMCDRLLQHSAIIEPQDELSKKTCETCLKYCGWSNETKANFLVNQSNILMKKEDLEEAELKFQEALSLLPTVRSF